MSNPFTIRIYVPEGDPVQYAEPTKSQQKCWDFVLFDL